MINRHFNYFPIFILLCLPLLGLGCAQRAAEETAERRINQQLGDQGRVSVQGENWEFEDAASGTKVNVGKSVPVPENFPKDVPLYEPGEIRAVSVNPSADQSAYLMIFTNDAATKVMQWYQEKLTADGWQTTGNFNLQGGLTAMYSQGTRALTVSTAPSGEEAFITALTIIITNQ